MTVEESLERLKLLAKSDNELKKALIATKQRSNPVSEFCKIAVTAGVLIGEMDLAMAGEESYAAMKRSTNGGGENSPLLKGEDDLYELFLAELI
ncbi:hypothetical protein P261_02369 [Lachnospiraceae bacterium TWA4]|nr:hypothetical protein P261_02369 [Lachnospiraceae bacterium TWA4]